MGRVSMNINPREPTVKSYCLHPSALNRHCCLKQGQFSALYLFHWRATEVDDSYLLGFHAYGTYIKYIIYII